MKTHTHGSQTDVIDGFSEEEEEGERSKDKGSCWVEAVGGHRERERHAVVLVNHRGLANLAFPSGCIFRRGRYQSNGVCIPFFGGSSTEREPTDCHRRVFVCL